MAESGGANSGRSPCCSVAGEEHKALQMLVVEEIVERPQSSLFAIRIRAEIRSVRIDDAVVQTDFLIDGCPKMIAESALVDVASTGRKLRVDCVHYLEKKWEFSKYGETPIRPGKLPESDGLSCTDQLTHSKLGSLLNSSLLA